MMKKVLFFLFVSIVLVGCTTAEVEPESQLTEMEAMSDLDMADLPCHKMPDGSLMGDCPVDEFGNPYVPTTDGGGHEHANDAPPHRH